MDSEPILKKTLVTVGTMVGAWVAFVGTVSLVAVVVTSHLVGSSGASAGAGDPGGSVTTEPGARATKADPLHPTPLRTTAQHATHDTI
jgi:hypothetical protein